MIIKSQDSDGRDHRNGGRPEISRYRKYIFSALLIPLATLLAVGFLVLCAEIILRVQYRGTAEGSYQLVEEYSSPAIYEFSPFQVVTLEGGVPAYFNNFGFRRSEDSAVTPPDGLYRVLSYGDSIGRGYQVDDNSHYPILLEQRLNAEGNTKYEVMNTARGSSPSIYAFHIRRDVPLFKPRMILLEIELLNDLGDEALISYSQMDRWSLPTAVNGGRYLIGWQGVPISTIPIFGYSFETMPTWIRLVRGVGHMIEKFRPNHFVSPESGRYYYHLWYDKFLLTERRIDRARSRMFETITGIRDYLEQRDIEFLLIILPSKYIFEAGPYRAHAAREYDLAVVEAVRRDIPYVSLREVMEKAGGEKLFMDFCHPTSEGYQVIAEELYRILKGRYFQLS